MYDVQDWAEVRRLFREGWTKTAIAEKLGMSRNTVADLVASDGPPRYKRRPAGSMLDAFDDAIAAMLDEDPKVAATVIAERLRRLGYTGGITILKQRVARLRPGFVAARSYQRTTYLPGELAHLDWWHTGVQVPVGRGATRYAFGLVASLPHSAAHACVFCFGRTTGDFCPALVGCLGRLGGVPAGAVVDNDASIVASLALQVLQVGDLSLKPVVLRPRFPEGKGQHDSWARTVAFERRPRRLAGTVADAWRVERGFLARLPSLLPDTDRRLEARVSKDGFVRVASADYSVPPGLAGRRVQVRLSPTELVVFLDGIELARHTRSFVPADVVLAPVHARALRLARQARRRLEDTDVAVPVVDLARYDAAVGIQR